MLLVNKIGDTPPNNEIWYTSVDNNIIDVDTTYINNNLLSNTYEDKGILVFENDVNYITGLFYNKSKLIKVWLPNCNIRQTVLAFGECTNLTMINNSKQLKNIEENTFRDCINLQQIEIDSGQIIDSAFSNCTSLKSVKISKRIEDIGDYVFYNCINLKSIDYEGTIEEWNNIDTRSDWRNGSVITTIHCSDGDIQL